ncbi:hypothetical protein N7456_001408 [Penicillium angulare]|uniref:Uncharacterized protein n=1 Tax=Penicillium angulare TaxID=116970 RepID=A0A9W9KN26_9EURO|nr:hypothetical protein N7456_001408 [Penicillium angulare]
MAGSVGDRLPLISETTVATFHGAGRDESLNISYLTSLVDLVGPIIEENFDFGPTDPEVTSSPLMRSHISPTPYVPYKIVIKRWDYTFYDSLNAVPMELPEHASLTSASDLRLTWRETLLFFEMPGSMRESFYTEDHLLRWEYIETKD